MIKILDFGFAVKYNSHKKLSTYWGTPNYMAPELIVKVPYDPNKMEVWSWGIWLYKLLTGKFPFTGRNDEDLKKQLQETEVEYPEYLSEKAIEILKKMLCKDQFERATTTEVLIDKWLYELWLKPEIKIKPKKKVKEEHKPSKLTGKDFMLDKSISKFALDDKIVKNILKLGYTEEFIHNEVENEESYIGKLYRKLYELKKQLMK